MWALHTARWPSLFRVITLSDVGAARLRGQGSAAELPGRSLSCRLLAAAST